MSTKHFPKYRTGTLTRSGLPGGTTEGFNVCMEQSLQGILPGNVQFYQLGSNFLLSILGEMTVEGGRTDSASPAFCTFQ